MPDEEMTDETTIETPAPEETPVEAEEAPLGAPGIRALHAEREARRQAEQAAAEARTELDAIRQSQMSEHDQLIARAEAGDAASAAATEKMRQANLALSLGEVGLVGQQARAVVRLLDGVEFDAADQPVNLTERLEAAKASYGDTIFSTEPPPAREEDPDLHHGARREAGDDRTTQNVAAFERQFFPELRPTEGVGA